MVRENDQRAMDYTMDSGRCSLWLVTVATVCALTEARQGDDRNQQREREHLECDEMRSPHGKCAYLLNGDALTKVTNMSTRARQAVVPSMLSAYSLISLLYSPNESMGLGSVGVE